MESTIAGVVFSFFGLVGVAGGLWNWQVLMEPSHNYSFIRALGPKGMRVFYVVLGFFLFGVGTAFLLGVIRLGGR